LYFGWFNLKHNAQKKNGFGFLIIILLYINILLQISQLVSALDLMIYIILIASFSTLFLYAIYRFLKFIHWQKSFSSLAKGPPVNFLFGNALAFAGGFNNFFSDLHSKHGSVVRYFIGPFDMHISVVDPKLVLKVFRDFPDRAKNLRMYLWYIGTDSLLFQDSVRAKELRNVIWPYLSSKNILAHGCIKCHEEISSKLTKWSSVDEYNDILDDLGQVTYRSNGSVLFNFSIKDLDELQLMHDKITTQNSKFYGFSEFNPFIKNNVRVFRNKLRHLISKDRTKTFFLSTIGEVDYLPLDYVCKRSDVVFSDEELVSNTYLFLNASYETTKYALYWSLWALAKYPSIQNDLRKEFLDNGLLGEFPHYTEFSKCEKLKSFLREVLRYRQPTFMHQRCNNSSPMNIGDLIVPQGVAVDIPHYIIFRNKELFGDDADLFNAMRFCGDSEQVKVACANWTGFGGYTRTCIGRIFVMHEMDTLIFSIVRDYFVTLENMDDAGETIVVGAITVPVTPARFKFVKNNPQ
jgi:cytochrome P450